MKGRIIERERERGREISTVSLLQMIIITWANRPKPGVLSSILVSHMGNRNAAFTDALVGN